MPDLSMGKEDGSTDRQKCGLWQQISGVICAPGVSQTLQKGGNTGCAVLSFVPRPTRVLHMENLPKVGMENWAQVVRVAFLSAVTG